MAYSSSVLPRKVLLLGSLAESLVNFRGDLIRELIAAGNSVVAAAPAMDEGVASRLQALGAEARSVEIARTGMNMLADTKSFLRLVSFMRREKPHAVIAYTAKPVIYGSLAAAIAGVPVRVAMITGLGYAFTAGDEPKRKLARRVAAALYKIALARTHLVIFQNPDDRDLFEKLGLLRGKAKVATVNGSGVNVQHFALAPLPPGPSFLMIARLLKDKGVREYAEAARSVMAKNPGARFSLAGWIDQSPDAVSQSELDSWQAAGIQYLGKLADVRPAIAGASIIVLPSYREGTPRTVLEGMAMGRAVITTDAPGCRETVEYGINGLLVPVRNATALADAMLALAGDPSRVSLMGKQSRRIACEKYEAGAVARSVIALAGLEQAS